MAPSGTSTITRRVTCFSRPVRFLKPAPPFPKYCAPFGWQRRCLVASVAQGDLSQSNLEVGDEKNHVGGGCDSSRRGNGVRIHGRRQPAVQRIPERTQRGGGGRVDHG